MYRLSSDSNDLATEFYRHGQSAFLQAPHHVPPFPPDVCFLLRHEDNVRNRWCSPLAVPIGRWADASRPALHPHVLLPPKPIVHWSSIKAWAASVHDNWFPFSLPMDEQMPALQAWFFPTDRGSCIPCLGQPLHLPLSKRSFLPPMPSWPDCQSPFGSLARLWHWYKHLFDQWYSSTNQWSCNRWYLHALYPARYQTRRTYPIQPSAALSIAHYPLRPTWNGHADGTKQRVPAQIDELFRSWFQIRQTRPAKTPLSVSVVSSCPLNGFPSVPLPEAPSAHHPGKHIPHPHNA